MLVKKVSNVTLLGIHFFFNSLLKSTSLSTVLSNVPIAGSATVGV